MWRRLRRKSMAPRRPLLFVEQYALAFFTAIALVGGCGFALWVVLGSH